MILSLPFQTADVQVSCQFSGEYAQDYLRQGKMFQLLWHIHMCRIRQVIFYRDIPRASCGGMIQCLIDSKNLQPYQFILGYVLHKRRMTVHIIKILQILPIHALIHIL